jgi:hypothetical protein
MAAEQSDLSQTLIRIVKSLGIHGLFAAILTGLIWWKTSAFTDASDGFRTDFSQEDVMATLDIVRGNLWEWSLYGLAASFILSALFLSIAQRRHPRNPIEGASHKGLWGGLLLGAIIIVGGLWWQFISQAEVQTQLMSGNYLTAVIGVTLGTIIAYWIATALAVTITMKPSVPLSGFLPTFWN